MAETPVPIPPEPEDRGSALRGLMSGVGRSVSATVRREVDAARAGGDGPAPARVAAAAIGGLVTGVGQNVGDLVREEIGAVRAEVLQSARAAGRGAGLLGAAAATGNAAVLFTGVAVWRGLGNRIGYARSAAVVAALAGAATAVLAGNGVAELDRARRRGQASRTASTTRRTPSTASGRPASGIPENGGA